MAVTWDAVYKEKPPGTQSPTLGDNRMRETRESIQERMTNAHYTVDDSQSTGSSATDWWHKMGSAKIWYQAAVPTVRVLGSSTGLSTSTSDDNGRLWFDSDATTPSLFVWNGTDFTTEIVGPATFVDMAEQTVTGAKTWSEAAIFSSTVAITGATTLSADLIFDQADPEIRGGDTDGVMYISPGVSNILGGSIRMYGDTHASKPDDIEFYGSATLQMQYDDSASTFNFQANALIASDLNLSADNPEILGQDTNGALIISANTKVLGANIWLYGDTHATNAGDMIFQDDETLELHFDASTSIWDFQTNAIQVDNININGNTISSTAGTDLLITPLAGQQLLLDTVIIVDNGSMTGVTTFGFAGGTSFTAIQTGEAANDTIPTKGYVDDQVASVFAAGAVSATIANVGLVTLATDAEAVAGTITTNKAINPGSLTARLAAPGAIGGTTPAAGTFTTLTTPLGIGTDDPQELLHLLSSSTHSRLEIETTATTHNAAIKLTTADTWQITSAGSGSDYGSGTFVISSEAGGARFYIDSLGRVGIGDKTEDDDSLIYFASDAYIFWNNSSDYFEVSKPIRFLKGQNTVASLHSAISKSESVVYSAFSSYIQDGDTVVAHGGWKNSSGVNRNQIISRIKRVGSALTFYSYSPDNDSISEFTCTDGEPTTFCVEMSIAI